MPDYSDALIDGFYSLGKNVNKLQNPDGLDTKEGAVSDYLPELTLSIDDEKLNALQKVWLSDWNTSSAKAEWDKKCEDNENYWKGKQFGKPEMEQLRPLVDNVIFEALETALPQMTRRNPECGIVLAQGEDDKDPGNQEYVKQLKQKLSDIADDVKLRLKIKKAARHWNIYLLGVAKMGWNLIKDQPDVRIVRPKKLILDPNGTIDEDGYTGKRIGEYRKMEAGILVELAPKHKDFLTKKAHNMLGTELQFIEWWTDKYLFWSMDERILLKMKNPHWNYDKSEKTVEVADNGEETEKEVETKGNNHLPSAKAPYIFLSIFNLGKQPVDDTSLISQNLSGQDRLNKLLKQQDKNIDSMNGGIVVSEEKSGLTKEEASTATEALRRGGTIVIPEGSPSEAIQRFNAEGLPADVYNASSEARVRIMQRFGASGLSPQGLENEDTNGGKILVKNADGDRNSGITDYLEQMADDIYNYIIQLLYVYDENFQGAHPKVKATVKEGSLLPKDSTTIANQAITLGTEGKMALVDMYKHLEYTDPLEMAANVWLEANAPELLFKDNPLVMQAIQAKQQAAAQGEKPPSESISFKDLPPNAKVQMLAKVGIQISPEELMAHEAAVEAKKQPVTPQT